MSDYKEQLPRWEAKGTEPPESIIIEGWKANQKPPADYFNWFFYQTYRALKELQELSALDEDLISHERSRNNPHNVTTEQIGTYSKQDIDAKDSTSYANMVEYLKSYLKQNETKDSSVKPSSYEVGTTIMAADSTYPAADGIVITSSFNDSRTNQICLSKDAISFFARGIKKESTDAWSDWKKVAYEDSNVASATKLQNKRSINLTGDLTGTVEFDGTSDANLTATMKQGSTSVAGKLQLTDSVSSTSTTTAATAASVKKTYDLVNTNKNSADQHAARTDNPHSVTAAQTGAYSKTETDTKLAATKTEIQSGNVATATKLQTARTISGISFDGSKNITISSGDVGAYSKTETDALIAAAKTAVQAGNVTSATKLATARNIKLTGAVTGTASFNGTADASIATTIAGNAPTATKLATQRTISLSGGVTGSATFDGSANISIAAAVANNSHTHTVANVTGLQAELNSKTNIRGYSNGAATAITSTDLNALTESGTFRGSNLTNAPDTGYWYVVNMVHNTSYITQIIYRLNSTDQRPRIRILNNGTWQAWQTLSLTTDNAPTATKLATARTVSVTGAVTGTATFDGSTNASIATSLTKSTVVNMIYPVGSIYMSASATSPATLFGGTWVRITGRFLVAAADGDADFSAGKTGGTKTLADHTHVVGTKMTTAEAKSGTAVVPTTNNTGGLFETPPNQLPPYLSVYMWRRTV